MSKRFLYSAGIREVSFRSRWSAAAFACAFALPGLFLAGESVRVGVAGCLAASFDPASLRRAAKIDPNNAEIHHKLGLYYLNSLEGADPQEAKEQFRRAAELSPHDSLVWSNLAAACRALADDECADEAENRALALSPMTPRAYWDAAVDDVMSGQYQKVLPKLRRVLELDSTYAPSAFRLFWDLPAAHKISPEGLLPPTASPALRLEYADFLCSRGEDALAFQVWTETVAGRPSLSFASAAPYLDRLISRGRLSEAKAVWTGLLSVGALGESRNGPQPLVFNGSFENVPLNAGFDWRAPDSPFVVINFRDPAAHSGERSVRLDFTPARNDGIEPLFQYVPVAPRQSYRLTGYLRSESLTSTSGPRLRVVDAACPSCLDAASAPTVGTTPWHCVRLDFATGPETRLVRLSLWRGRSRSYPTEMEGTLWLDDVALEPAPISIEPEFPGTQP